MNDVSIATHIRNTATRSWVGILSSLVEVLRFSVLTEISFALALLHTTLPVPEIRVLIHVTPPERTGQSDVENRPKNISLASTSSPIAAGSYFLIFLITLRGNLPEKPLFGGKLGTYQGDQWLDR